MLLTVVDVFAVFRVLLGFLVIENLLGKSCPYLEHLPVHSRAFLSRHQCPSERQKVASAAGARSRTRTGSSARRRATTRSRPSLRRLRSCPLAPVSAHWYVAIAQHSGRVGTVRGVDPVRRTSATSGRKIGGREENGPIGLRRYRPRSLSNGGQGVWAPLRRGIVCVCVSQL